MSKQTLLQFVTNVPAVYASVFATWWLLSAATGTPLGGEDGAFLQSIYSPLATTLTVIIVYTISILDHSIRRTAVVAIATAITQTIVFVFWPDRIITEEYIIALHLVTLATLFGGWTTVNRFFLRSPHK